MEVLNHRAALLSNYEVLTLLRELEGDHLARTKTALRIKKEDEAAGLAPKYQNPADDISENLRTVEVEWDLTKAEKLQVVNLAPTEAVELYVIVEEFEDRFGERMDDMLNAVKGSLQELAAKGTVNGDNSQEMQAETVVYSEYQEEYNDPGNWGTFDPTEVVFDDNGEGVGIEGDLDVEDDG
ncbi:uncharacterized protein BXZ73DRAFT_101270 [Epithele typhae]|uniref:uncharacterized protein n=1 Tax=Epithele typhae TaxID=378194 RepID=UPI002007FB52|nr:uncharacterized protein BXZ73DRAFT_101270 [Epithele typhae]KAH9932731.1 hypothetical protein BXZ73DRAFT_101270 [Epithele typhae]